MKVIPEAEQAEADTKLRFQKVTIGSPLEREVRERVRREMKMEERHYRRNETFEFTREKGFVGAVSDSGFAWAAFFARGPDVSKMSTREAFGTLPVLRKRVR
jgi:hypothetical protein